MQIKCRSFRRVIASGDECDEMSRFGGYTALIQRDFRAESVVSAPV
jgi:hypothetical protein